MNSFANIPYNKDSLKWNPTGETIVALGLIAFLIVLSIIIFIMVKVSNPLKRPKGLLLIIEWVIEKLDGFVETNMGKGFEDFGGYLLGMIPFLFLSFTIGITGLPTPMSNLAVPLTLSLCTFILIHATSVRFTKWKYFKRYIDPLPIFLPVNLLSMWAPLLSMTLRMFGNAIVGFVLISVLNWAVANLGSMIFSISDFWLNEVPLTPIITPVFHAYFDLFSGFIQTLVFTSLTVLLIAQEKPVEEEINEQAVLAIRKEANT